MKTLLGATLLLLSAASSLSGCYDYRSGKHWNVENAADWQQLSSVKWVNNACGSPTTISTQRAREGAAHSLFLIPLGLGWFANNPPTTDFTVYGKGLTGHCDSTSLVVAVNGQTQTNTEVSACSQSNDCCIINVPVNRSDMESLQVAINTSAASCAYTPLKLDSGRHFCLRGTQFGGSDGCNYGPEAGEEPKAVKLPPFEPIGLQPKVIRRSQDADKGARSVESKGAENVLAE